MLFCVIFWSPRNYTGSVLLHHTCFQAVKLVRFVQSVPELGTGLCSPTSSCICLSPLFCVSITIPGCQVSSDPSLSAVIYSVRSQTVCHNSSSSCLIFSSPLKSDQGEFWMTGLKFQKSSQFDDNHISHVNQTCIKFGWFAPHSPVRKFQSLQSWESYSGVHGSQRHNNEWYTTYVRYLVIFLIIL